MITPQSHYDPLLQVPLVHLLCLQTQVRSGMVSFLAETVYGNRSAFQEVLLVVSSDKGNVPIKSKFGKSGHVGQVSMLPRSEMAKLPRDSYGTEGRFTRVQELKQARVFLEMESIRKVSPA